MQKKVLHISFKEFGNGFCGGIEPAILKSVQIENKIYYSRVGIFNKKFENNLTFNLEKNWKKKIEEYEPDVVIFHSFYVFFHLKIALYLKKKKIPYLIKPHGSFSVQNLKKSRISYLKKKIAFICFFNNYISCSAGLVYLNEGERDQSFVKSKLKNYILANSIDKLNELIFDEKTKQFIIVYIGRIELELKGLSEIFEMVEKNKQFLLENKIKIEIYGFGNYKEIKKMYKKIANNFEIISFNGYADELKKKEAFGKSSVSILNSKTEAMPMSVLESLSYGIPCIVSKETNFLKEVEKFKSGWGIQKQGIFETVKKAYIDYSKNSDYFIKNTQNHLKKYLPENLKNTYKEEYEKIFKDLNL